MSDPSTPELFDELLGALRELAAMVRAQGGYATPAQQALLRRAEDVIARATKKEAP